MARQPRPKAWDTLAGWRPFLQGTLAFDTVVRSVQVTQVVVSQGLHRFGDCRRDNHLYDIAVTGWVHLHLRGKGRRCPRPGPAGARTRMGDVPGQGPGIHMGMATSSTTRCSVAMRLGHLGWCVY